MEQWKNIKDIEGYQASNLGRIRNKKLKILNPKLNRNGYLEVHLRGKSFQKIGKVISVHRLISITFLPTIKQKQFVNHKDGNKTNNNIYNIEWVNQSENMQHAINNNLTKSLSNKDILLIRRLYKTKKYTQKELGVKFNVYQATISRVTLKQCRWWI
jgi:hypothetical protein